MRRIILVGLVFLVLRVLAEPIGAAAAAESSFVQTEGAVHVGGTVSVGVHPNGIAVDSSTHLVYVANGLSDTVSIIDGSTPRVVTTVPVGRGPGAVAVDPSTHSVYVADIQDGSLSVLDGTSNRVTATLPIRATALAVDSATHTVYVGVDSNPITITGADVQFLDEATGRVTATVAIGSGAMDSSLRSIAAVAVDPSTQTVYVGSNRKYEGESSISMIDGRTRQQIAMVPTGNIVSDVGVDANNHRVLATVPFPFKSLELFDGATPPSFRAKPVTLHLGNRPLDVAVDPSTQIAYVANADDNTVSVVDENANQVLMTVPLGADARNPGPLTVDPTTHAVYVANQGSNTVTVLDGLTQPASVPHDARYFAQTGYRIDNDTIWDYFQRRGGVPTFGYPTSRTFTFQGFTVQFFQRRIVQLDQNGNARLLNLLDPGLLNYTQFNGSTFPGVDSGLVSTAPNPTNQPAVLAWVQQHAPDTVGSDQTNFFHTFNTTVSAQIAFPNGGDPSLLPGIELELWGIPTSGASTDPNNHNFIYLRWQRGTVMYDASTGLTQGVLLADYLKAIITGRDLPADLAQEAANSPLLKQYDPGAPGWVRDPSLLPDTDLTNAFTQE